MLNKFLCLLSAFLLAQSGCGRNPDTAKPEILVSAALSLKGAFESIGEIYERDTGNKVQFNFGASGILERQIEEGAPVDVFASAGEEQMNRLEKAGFIDAEAKRVLTRNSLVLAVSTSNNRAVDLSTLSVSRSDKVAMGNPKTVPAGYYAAQALKRMQLWDGLQSRLVFAENVRQVADYVVTGEVAAGLMYQSEVASAGGKFRIAERIPESAHDIIVYPIAVVTSSRYPVQALHFVTIAVSQQGQRYLRQFGFPGVE